MFQVSLVMAVAPMSQMEKKQYNTWMLRGKNVPQLGGPCTDFLEKIKFLMTQFSAR